MSDFSQQTLAGIKKECERYETKRSAILPCLYIVQDEKGWISPEDMKVLSKLMDVPVAWIQEVASFYTMYNKTPVGKYHVQVCNNISCCMNGSKELTDYLCEKLDIKPGEVSQDGRFTISKVECLGSCGTAPMMQVNNDYYESLTPESALDVLNKLGE